MISCLTGSSRKEVTASQSYEELTTDVLVIAIVVVKFTRILIFYFLFKNVDLVCCRELLVQLSIWWVMKVGGICHWL